MNSIVKLYSNKIGEISRFLNQFETNHSLKIENDLLWQKEFKNPIEIADIIGALMDNKEDYEINMWISLDKNLLINITPNNADDVIRYLYERYPY